MATKTMTPSAPTAAAPTAAATTAAATTAATIQAATYLDDEFMGARHANMPKLEQRQVQKPQWEFCAKYVANAYRELERSKQKLTDDRLHDEVFSYAGDYPPKLFKDPATFVIQLRTTFIDWQRQTRILARADRVAKRSRIACRTLSR